MTELVQIPEEVRSMAKDIVRLGDQMDTRLFVVALAVAAGSSIATNFQETEHERVALAHYHGVIDTMRKIANGTSRQ